MKNLQANLILCITTLFLLCGASLNTNQLRITSLNNCGFLYSSANAKVLIDPFGTQYGKFFYLTSGQTQNNIIEGKTPFDNVDLLLITHIHGDHFNAFLAQEFLLKNTRAKMICPPQVYNQMKDSCTSFEQIKSRIISPQLNMHESKKFAFNKILVTIIRMQHGTSRSLEGIDYSAYTEYEKTENFGYVIKLNDKIIFHQGDACLKINGEALKAIKNNVNIAYLSYFDWDSTSYSIVKNKLHADKVIFMHGTQPAKEMQKEDFQKVIPQLIFFKEELEEKEF
jgi:L-ascorbate metabolism protein UlaG (beta-lactamase superfamily)